MTLRLAVGVVLVAAAPVHSQDPQRPPPIRTGVELVRVDATVLDRRGQPVPTLMAADFTIEENGVPQRIEQFRLVELTGHQVPGDDLSLEIRSRHHGNTEAARDDVRVFLVVWDDYHIPQFPAATVLRAALDRFLRTMVAPTDLVALMTQWTPADAIEFTRDLNALALRAAKLEGRQGDCMPRNAAEERHLMHLREIEGIRTQVSVTALEAAIAHLGALREGRKMLLYFSREFAYSFDRTLELIRAASNANVAFYSINPDGLSLKGVRSGLLTDLARNTGGESLETNAVDVALGRAITQSSASYLLGYTPSPPVTTVGSTGLRCGSTHPVCRSAPGAATGRRMPPNENAPWRRPPRCRRCRSPS